MANDINKLIIIGRLTRDPELRFTPTNVAIASLAIANNRSWTGQDGERKETVSFYNCIAWGKTGQIIAQYFKKGQRILIEGRLQTRAWLDKHGNKRIATEIVIENFNFIESAKSESGAVQQEAEVPEAGQEAVQSFDDLPPSSFNDDDCPF